MAERNNNEEKFDRLELPLNPVPPFYGLDGHGREGVGRGCEVSRDILSRHHRYGGCGGGDDAHCRVAGGGQDGRILVSC